MLFELRDYLMQQQAVSLQQLAWHFQQPPDVLRCCLQHWIRKGKVLRCAGSSSCGSRCQLCRPEAVEYYQWLPVNSH